MMLTWINRHFAQPLDAWRTGNRHLRHLRSLERSQYDTSETIAARQLAALQKMVRHAWDTVPFYRERWAAAGLRPDALRTLADLQAFPVLTKADLRQHGSQLRSDAFRDRPTIAKTTSGSTGVPLTVHVNREAMAFKRACTIRSDQWSGYRLGSRVARLWGHGVAERGPLKARARRYLVDRERYLNTLDIDAERMHSFAESLERRPPGLIFGHAHSLYLFAAYVCKHFPGRIRADGVISAAMILHDWQRSVIEKAFGVPVTNRYGCEETSLIASECEVHRGLHINADGLYTEVASFKAGESGGRIIVTDLINQAMPLIRYQVGDVVVPSTRACSCGRGLPLIEQVIGREADYVLTPSGTLISGISLTDHFATEVRGAAQVQIVQEELRCLRLRMVAGDEFGPTSRHQIESLVRKTFGPEMRYDLELVDAIPQEPSGKYRFCVSPVATAFIRDMMS